jgi:hypothetical protein
MATKNILHNMLEAQIKTLPRVDLWAISLMVTKQLIEADSKEAEIKESRSERISVEATSVVPVLRGTLDLPIPAFPPPALGQESGSSHQSSDCGQKRDPASHPAHPRSRSLERHPESDWAQCRVRVHAATQGRFPARSHHEA